jgi:hypothetical protein
VAGCRPELAWLIGDDLAWRGADAQHPLEETFSRELVASLLRQAIKRMLIHVDILR